jgi:hypothetical protein
MISEGWWFSAGMLFCTIAIAYYTRITSQYAELQYSISNEARKDGLFKLRYKLHYDIVLFIQKELKMVDSAIHLNLRDETVRASMCDYRVYEGDVQYLTTKARRLFGDDELAKFLETKLMDSSFSCSKGGRKLEDDKLKLEEYESKIRNAENDLMREQVITERERYYKKQNDDMQRKKEQDYWWTPNEEFNAQFEKYLKLK